MPIAAGDVVLTDDFTYTVGAALETANPAWAKLDTNGGVITTAQRFRANASNANYYHSATPTSPQYDVRGDLYIASATGSVGYLGRVVGTGATKLGYGGRYSGSSGSWNIF